MKKRRDLKFKDIVFPPGARLQQLGPYWPHPTSTRARKPADSSPQVSDNRHKRSGGAGRNPAYTKSSSGAFNSLFRFELLADYFPLLHSVTSVWGMRLTVFIPAHRHTLNTPSKYALLSPLSTVTTTWRLRGKTSIIQS